MLLSEVRRLLIERAVSLCPLVNETEATIAHVDRAVPDLGSVAAKQIRRLGRQLSKDELRSVGLRANTLMTAEFISCLSEEGRKEPLHAAGSLARILLGSWASAKQLGRLLRMFGDEGSVKLRASNMRIGPCSAAAALDGQIVSVREAPILPMIACSHPDQCGCTWIFVLQIDASNGS